MVDYLPGPILEVYYGVSEMILSWGHESSRALLACYRSLYWTETSEAKNYTESGSVIRLGLKNMEGDYLNRRRLRKVSQKDTSDAGE